MKKFLFLLITWFILILFLYIYLKSYASRTIVFYWDIIVSTWQWINNVFQNFSEKEQKSFKLYKFFNWEVPNNILPWIYTLSWSYSKEELFNIFEKWPKISYLDITIIEWWSIYDIDNFLSSRWYVNEWDYINFVNNETYISRYKERYEFLWLVDWLKNFEGFLYPETYKVDVTKNIIDQLVYLQLETFNNFVWMPYKEDFNNFNTTLRNNWYNFTLNFYEIITLASIIEKEEFLNSNKPIIAWIFLNRINDWRRLDADITLCYWLLIKYNDCTTAVIVQNLYDRSNLYNTRQNMWLTPTPITSPHISSILSVIKFTKNNYYFYLHDRNWLIHPSINIQDHNIKKSKYLSN